MIAFQNVSKVYGGNRTVLEEINLKIKPGEFVSIVGKSAAGKTTLLKLLIGEEKPTKGRVIFGSYEINKLNPKDFPSLRRQMGIVFQDFKLLPTKSAFENVAFALEVDGHPQEEIEELVPQVLDIVGLKERQHNFPDELSGGEKQRVAIARAMVHNPSILIADEPTGNLDKINTDEIMKLLVKINTLGTTVILATHNDHIVNAIGKRVVSMVDGRIVRDEEKGKYIFATFEDQWMGSAETPKEEANYSGPNSETIDLIEQNYKDGIFSEDIYKLEKNLVPVIEEMEKNDWDEFDKYVIGWGGRKMKKIRRLICSLL